MRILFFCDNTINPQIGGIERVTYSLSENLSDKGYSISWVYTIKNEKDTPATQINNIFEYSIPSFSKTNGELQHSLNNLFSEKKFDIVINQSTFQETFKALVNLKKVYKFKLISTIHTDPLASLKSIKDLRFTELFNARGINKSLLKFKNNLQYPISYLLRLNALKTTYSKIYKYSDATVLLSNKFLKPFLKYSKIIENNKLFAIPNPCSFDTEKNSPKKINQVLFVSRMIFDAKRPDRILRIWAYLYEKFPDWKLLMLGDGLDLDKIKFLAKSCNLKNIQFLGRVNPEKYYKQSKIVCLVSSYEGFGMVLTEGMQYGCVPVAYNSFESLTDIIEDSIDGFIIPTFKYDKFVKKMELLMNNELLRENMSKNAIESCKKFDVNVIANEWINLFKKLH